MRPQAAATAAAAAASAASVAPIARATVPQPIAFNASDWLGIDGNWSTFAFLAGNNDPVNVLFSTSISEFWAIGPGGCSKTDARCVANRGGVYNPSNSKHWSGLGTWQLGLPDLGTGGSGQYGFDTIAAYSPITGIAFSMSNVLMSAITSTDYYLGYFGVGLRSGNFGDIVASPPLRQAVSSFGWIPSYSYGYTAGASYRGIVGSATLGGFDAARFVPHDNTFTMNQTEGVPRPLVRGIEVSAKNGSRPDGWNSATQLLMNYNQHFTAVIDTTTPYLWLPSSVCDNFAKVLNLTYNNTFGLYTLTNDQYRQYSSNTSPLSFTFSLSSKDNNDNFDFPLAVPGVVNITLPIQAFVSLLSPPFMNATIKEGDPGVPYFTLRRAPTNTFIIGNAFLQESYLITTYDSGTFSVHQARFPSDPIAGAQVQGIKQPPNSQLPPPPDPNASKGLSTGEMVGIAVGAVAFFSVLVLALFCYRRHKRQLREKAGDDLDDGKDTSSTINSDTPSSPVSRMFSRIVGRRRSRRTGTVMTALGATPSEAPDCQIYELPAPIPPAELDAGGGDDHSILEDTDLGTDSTQHLSAYEIARRKLDRQLQGPLPEYTPPEGGAILHPEKSSIPDLQPSDQTQTIDQPSPISPTRSRGTDSNSNTFLASEPSPVSPRGDWSSAEFPSPVTTSMPPRSYSSGTRSRGQSTTSRSLSTNSNAPPSPATDTMPPIPASFQRTPIDPSKVVCLGPLPQSVQLPGQSASTASRISVSAGRSLPASMLTAGSRASQGSLGSNFTEEEDRVAEETSRQGSLNHRSLNQQHHTTGSRMTRDRPSLPTQPEEREDEDKTPNTEAVDSDGSSETGRIDPGRDLIHVPQMAAKRYSWEEHQPPQ
ncbi:hypothetical protein QQS21_012552 [Conoideocrella luteorostrata]|uniref:Peptidase A1 domain-containing protein n=1 Tax=Conoideocrella luteorostrata TaxID=1105319 RepID=A0AAJ0CBA0_9HYPO|nr:hypothetical protein QQS21_012552 [Conoideocrella luteorostrata]